MAKFLSFAQFPVDRLFQTGKLIFVLLLCHFAELAYFIINCFISSTKLLGLGEVKMKNVKMNM